jgi:WhiB family redox-sensing transcriptional regulator
MTATASLIASPARSGHERRRSAAGRAVKGGQASLVRALGEVPELPGALCRGRGSLFDGARPRERAADLAYRHAAAVGLCRRCPELGACRAWVESAPKITRAWLLTNVVAGQVPESASDPTSPSRVKTKCSKGHVYDAANTYVDPSGRRRCRKCGCKK